MSTYIKEQSEWKEKWKNFAFEEFKCSCCGVVKIDEAMLDLVQEARDTLGSLSITSAYRCSSHNSSVAKTGANGPHTTGHALDIGVKFIYVNLHKRTIRVENRVEELRT